MLKEAKPILKIFNSEMIVGKFGEDINLNFVERLADCLYSVFESNNMSFVVGRDTLKASEFLENLLVKKLSKLGCKVVCTGVTTSGAISLATNFFRATAGVMITASARCAKFVGFKIFNGNGYAISDEQLSKLEFLYKNNHTLNLSKKNGEILMANNFNKEYLNFINSHLNFKTFPFKIAIDVGKGAGTVIVKDFIKVFHSSKVFGENFDGKNINDFQNEIDYSNYDFYIKLTGDCDRLQIYDTNGKKLEGDFLIAFFARIFQKQNKHFSLVSNLYTNNAYFSFFDKKKITYFMSGIGEKRIAEKMLQTNSEIGGEKFGNILNFNNIPTSDAFLTIVMFFNFLCDYPQVFEEISKLKLNPQAIKKVALNEINLKSDKFLNVLSAYEALLENDGKIIIRQDKLNEYVHIFIECPNFDLANKICDNLVNLLV